jgi:hypothetical protein
MAKKMAARAKKTTAPKKTTSPKKATARKKAAKTSKAVKPGRTTPLQRRPPTKSAKKAKPPKRALPMLDYGPTFFLTAQSDTAPAYEIDGTPHHRTVRSYRMERAAILEFEEQDGKILYKVKPVQLPAG